MNEAIYAYAGDAVVYTAPKAVYEIERSIDTPLSGVGARVAKYARAASKVLAIVGILTLVVAYAPGVYYSLLGVQGNTALLGKVGRGPVDTQIEAKPGYLPKYDTTLPEGHLLSVPSAGIETQIHEATMENYEDALQKGVWRVGNFATPGGARPMILAAHRYGYLKWSISYRLKNSFFRLPKANVGDVVEVVWNKRKYVYEIYAEVEGEQISDYSADLILYTCKDLNSDKRLFTYARLLEI